MDKPDWNVFVIDTLEAFEGLCSHVADCNPEYISLDVETDSVTEKVAKLYGIGLCFNKTDAFYIPIRRNDTSEFWDQSTVESIYNWITEQCRTRKLIGWNLIYDTLVYEYNTGHSISDYIYSDGILLKHCLEEERPFGLKEVALKYLGDWANKAQETLKENIKANGGLVTKDNFQIFKADLEVIADYCGFDVLLTRALFDIFEPRLKEEGLYELFYNEEIMPFYKEVLIDMKRKGFHVDVEYFKQLRTEINADISALEDEIHEMIAEDVKEFELRLLSEDYPEKRTGNFPKMVAEYFHIPLPYTKEGNPTLSKTAISKFNYSSIDPVLNHHNTLFYGWLLGRNELPREWVSKVQRYWYAFNNPDKRYVFNLKSNDHLGWLIFSKLGVSPKDKTETGKPKCDDDLLDSIKKDYPFIARLIDLKKLIKLNSTYIEGILDVQVGSVIYTSYLLFGTTSGRLSSRAPNLQNLPRVKEDDSNLSGMVLKYTNAIKKGFVAPKGYVLVNADYSALEPRCFSHVAKDPKLQNVFHTGEDLYSRIAIEIFGITDCSSYPNDKNFLKKKYPELRQKAKVLALAVVYGAEAGRIAQLLDIDFFEAKEIIDNYLNAFPGLKEYMRDCDYRATKKGISKTDFGRIRHLPQAKELFNRYGSKLLYNKAWVKEQGLSDTKYTLKNALNNSKNFPIQGLAAHIVNRAMIKVAREFRQSGIDAWICAQTHDEVTCVARVEQGQHAAAILKRCMETAVAISVPLVAEPLIGPNWAAVK